MPNRIIKETVKTSEKIDSLTWFEEVLYYRMLVTADDYGCLDGRTVLLKNELFPLKENVTKKSVEEAIAKLVKVGLLCRYTANDKPYLFFPTWEKHQRVRNKLRRFPDPYENGAEITCQSIDGQLTADCPPESESESESESNKESEESAFASAAMQSTFNEWIAYKSERRETYKPKGKQALISRLQKEVDERGEDAVIDAINYSMSHGWKGIYYPDKIAGKPNDTKRVHDELAEWMQEVNI